jgi:hypothetical protein
MGVWEKVDGSQEEDNGAGIPQYFIRNYNQGWITKVDLGARRAWNIPKYVIFALDDGWIGK